MLPVAGHEKFSKNCPNCGAPVQFRFAQAVQTVCPYCQSVLVRHDVNLEDVGKKAVPLVDSSPIQLGTEGIVQNRPFVVVGRICYEYPAGRWNEWHLVFSDGSSGWLSDAQLDYAVSFLTRTSTAMPAYPNPGEVLNINNVNYVITTVTKARYVSVEGDLPFTTWDREFCLFADLRTHNRLFATIDYSENPPLVFTGVACKYDELKLKNVRNFEGWPQ